MQRGGKHNAVHYVKKQPVKKESESTKEEPEPEKPSAVGIPAPEPKDPISILMADLSTIPGTADSIAKFARSESELAETVHDILMQLYKQKKPLADTIEGVLQSHRGISVLKELTESQLSDVVGIIVDIVKQWKLKEERIGCLRLLSHLIYEHHKLQGMIEKIIDIIIVQCGRIADEPKVSRQAFNCLGNLLFQYSEVLRPKADTLLNVTTSAFLKVTSTLNTEISSQVKDVQTVTRCLGYCLSYPKTLSADFLESVFMKLYKLLFIGTPYAKLKVFEPKVAESSKVAAAVSSSSSGSEISDPEDLVVTHSATFDRYGKIRTHALLCIQQMCRLNDRFMFEKWHLLLPRYAFTTPEPILKTGHKWEVEAEKLKKWSTSSEPNFLAIMNISKDSKVRVAVANTISAIIDHSPIKMWQGSLGSLTGPKKSGIHAFTSLSEALGNVIISFHYVIIHYLWTETDQIVQLQLLKALSILLNITKYEKIPSGLITYILTEAVWKIMQSPKSETTLLSCLNCFTSVANQRFAHTEFSREFLDPSSARNVVKFILSSAHTNESARAIECLVLFSKLCKNYSTCLQPYWPEILEYIKTVFLDKQPPTTLGCVRLLEEYVKHHNAMIYMNQPVAPNADLFDNKEFVAMFEGLVRTHVACKTLAEIPSSSVTDMQNALMNVLGIMSESQWKKLPAEVVACSVNFVMGVKGSGMPQSVVLKALGNMITYECFNKDLEFVSKCVSKIISNRSDTSMMVATKNSWALANLSYCLESLAKLEKYPELADCALAYAKSPKEKICSNGIRALGYILKKAETKDQLHIGKQSLDLVLHVIVSHLPVKSPKISWNACVSIGNIISNQNIPKTCLLYTVTTFNALLAVIAEKPNIKTKIHAIQALQSYRAKSDFTPCFEKLITTLVTLYNEIGEMQFEDVTEYKYRDKLEAMIIDTLCYIFGTWGSTAAESDYICNSILNKSGADILGVLVAHLRKVLKIEVGEVTTSKEEAKAAAKENEAVLKKVQALAGKMSEWAKSSKAHLSFGVIEHLREMAATPVEEYHFLQALVQTKSKPKFSQTFQQHHYDQYVDAIV